jgi:hypothetical protein
MLGRGGRPDRSDRATAILDPGGRPDRSDDPRFRGRPRDGGRQQDAGPVRSHRHSSGATRRAADRGHIRHRRHRHRQCLRQGEGHRQGAANPHQASGGLSEADIQKMVKDAESHAEEDKKRKAQVEAKNHGEALVYSTEKTLAEHGSKVGEADRRAIENAMADLKEALKGSDADAMTAKTNALAQASMKLGEAMYKQSAGQPAGVVGTAEGKKDDVVDAEFTEVDDDKKNIQLQRPGKEVPLDRLKAEVLSDSLDELIAEHVFKVRDMGPWRGSEAKAIFVPDYLKSNAYRVLRLSASSNYSKVHQASAIMRRAAKLGLVNGAEADMPVLGKISRTEADIQTAISRINNPVQRLRDRLFWFYLTPELLDAKTNSHMMETFGDNPEAVAALNHDKALHVLLAAIRSGMDEAGVQLWIRALQAWHQIVSDDSYWSLTLGLEERGDFEPAAFSSEVDALRDEAVELAAEAFLVATRSALARNELPTVRRVMDALQNLIETGPWVAHAQDNIISPTFEQFQKLCGDIREECGKRIVREQDASARNKPICDEALRRFRGEIEPALDRLGQIIPPDHHFSGQSREEAARCLCSIAIEFTWAGDFVGSEILAANAVRLAGDTVTAMYIQDCLVKIQKNKRLLESSIARRWLS